MYTDYTDVFKSIHPKNHFLNTPFKAQPCEVGKTISPIINNIKCEGLFSLYLHTILLMV